MGGSETHKTLSVKMDLALKIVNVISEPHSTSYKFKHFHCKTSTAPKSSVWHRIPLDILLAFVYNSFYFFSLPSSSPISPQVLPQPLQISFGQHLKKNKLLFVFSLGYIWTNAAYKKRDWCKKSLITPDSHLEHLLMQFVLFNPPVVFHLINDITLWLARPVGVCLLGLHPLLGLKYKVSTMCRWF